MIVQDTASSQATEAARGLTTLVADLLAGLTGTAVSGALVANVLLSLLVILFVLLGRRVLLRMVDKRLEDPAARYRWSKSTSYASSALVLLVLIQIWFEAVRSVGTFLGLLSAGVAIALRDPVVNLAGWVFVMTRRPFEPGDRIQVGGHSGDVVDIRPFQFTLLEIGNWVDADQSTGRIIHVPNQKVFTEPIANYTSQFEYIWNEVAVLVTFESDWRKAKEILSQIGERQVGGLVDEARAAIRRSSRRFLIHYQKLSPIVYLTVKDSGVLLTLRHLCLPRTRRGISQSVWEAVLEAFAAEPDIELAYPTQRVFYQPAEGRASETFSAKPGIQAEQT